MLTILIVYAILGLEAAALFMTYEFGSSEPEENITIADKVLVFIIAVIIWPLFVIDAFGQLFFESDTELVKK